jgi:hypothetical protein
VADGEDMEAHRQRILVATDGSTSRTFLRLCGVVFVLISAGLLSLAIASSPAAARSAYSFDGGTPRERATVRAALDASSFDWNLVPGHVTIHIISGGRSHARCGEIWLGSALLGYRRAAWGIVQHEYAHQVDYFLFDAKVRARLDRTLGGKTWWPDGRFRHDQYGAERFASTLAWAYWPSPHNTLIRYAHEEATALPQAQFRRLVDQLLA